MSTETTTTSSRTTGTTGATTAPEPPLPPPPATFVSSIALGWVPLTLSPQTLEGFRRQHARQLPIRYDNLATLKILLPEASADLIIAPYGHAQIAEIVAQILRTRL